MDLKLTAGLMCSPNYKDRFIAEYWQTKERYERLKSFCNKIEAHQLAKSSIINGENEGVALIPCPAHDCPLTLLRQQQKAMGEYLHTLEIRAIIENIELTEPTEPQETKLSNIEKLRRIYEALENIVNDLDEICSDEQELLIAMDERDPRYEGKELVLACLENAAADVGEAHEIIESILEDEQ